MNLLINFDHGVMPAAALEIQSDLGISNFNFGWLGSIVFLGLTIGSLSGIILYEIVNSKYLLISVLIANSIALAFFTVFKNFVLLLLCRFLSGFF